MAYLLMMLLSMLVLQIRLMFRCNFNGIFLIRRHGPKMAAHPQKTKYMITGTRQKLSRFKERFLGLDIDPSLSW